MARSRTSFAPGRSGNAGGRPRALDDIQALARVHTPAAIAALVAALDVPSTRVPAAVALLERAWGKPAQTITSDGAVEMIVTGVRGGEDREDAPAASCPSVVLTH